MIEVLAAGPATTVQDLGRDGYGHLGVPGAGAVDRLNLRIANRLVGNPDAAAALEMAAEGVSLRFDTDLRVALTGGTLELQLDGAPAPMYQTLFVKAGMELRCGRVLQGWRSYLSLAGGLRAEPVLGSRSTDSLARLGPAALMAGTRLQAGPVSLSDEGVYMRSAPRYLGSARLRILAGPHQEWFSPEALLALRTAKFRVSSQSDRIGLRLEGQTLRRLKEAELPSMGMVEGAIQVPGSGQPIVLMSNHGATGGYPVIANVIAADMHLAAQLAPGAEVSFLDVSRAEALQALRQQEQRLSQDLVAADASLLAARALMQLAGDHASLQRAAVTDGTRRIRIRK
jgi:biotin-dependent carboxylase-like uncharacterized protein